MSIFVDTAMIAAKVRQHDSRWCHLMSDQLDPAELHEFAARIGLKRSWFQPGKNLLDRTKHDPPGDHYDITLGKRAAAVAAGAIEIDRAGLIRLMRQRRDAWKAAA